jgi:hypothetical protein
VPFLLFSYLALSRNQQLAQTGWLASLANWAFLVLLGYWARSSWQPFQEIIPAGRQPVHVVQGQAG